MEEQVMKAVKSGVLEVDEDGRIWRLKKRGWDRWKKRAVDRPCKRVRAENKTGLGYLQIRVMVDGKRAQVGAHRIVFRCLTGEIPNGMTINHRNGDKADNRPVNLEVATYTEQAQHSIRVLKRHKTLNQFGLNNNQGKLSDEDVLMIRKARKLGSQLKELATEYNVSFQTISQIALGKRRSGVL